MKEAPADTATLPILAARRVSEVLSDYFALTKPRLNFLVVATSAAGYYLGGPPSADVPLMTQAVAGDARARRSSPAARPC
jgi:heme O synthase-like polyprenyltransferase